MGEQRSIGPSSNYKEKLSKETQVKFPVVQKRRAKIGGMTGSGLFDEALLTDPSLTIKPAAAGKDVNSSYEIELPLNPKRPVNYVWVRAGSISTGPLNSDVEGYGGTHNGRVKIASFGKTLISEIHAGTWSFSGRIVKVEKTHPEDRRFLGTSGWWGKSRLSNETPKRRRTKKPTS